MKKIFLNLAVFALIGIVAFSCDDDRDDYYSNITPEQLVIDSIKVNSDTMQVFEVQSIRTYSTYSTSCDYFYGYDYVHTNDTVRTVTAYHYYSGDDCTENIVSAYSQFNFQPRYEGTYTFKFWNGTDSLGDDVWITKDIVVE